MPTKTELQAKCDQLERDNAELVRQLQRLERQLSGQLLPEECQPADRGQFGYRELLYGKPVF